MASRIEPLMTVAQLDACPDDNNRYELIGGELFVSRAPDIPHQRVLLNLEIALSHYLGQNPIGILVPGTGMILSDYDAVIPDLAFVRNERWDEVVTGEKFTRAVDLVIEIVSPGKENRERDLTVKRQLYAKYGVREYWIVDSENLSVFIFRLREQTLEEIVVVSGDKEVTSPQLPGFQLQVKAIFNF
ncbi:MAG TPA: Uma2 family endonuclease [Pyrinomonadaceae bacterium]|nr:Uma2 family endonuclease [Pyrinomonadaceae bacterium]